MLLYINVSNNFCWVISHEMLTFKQYWQIEGRTSSFGNLILSLWHYRDQSCCQELNISRIRHNYQAQKTHEWLSARLQWPQCISNIVLNNLCYHQFSNIHTVSNLHVNIHEDATKTETAFALKLKVLCGIIRHPWFNHLFVITWNTIQWFTMMYLTNGLHCLVLYPTNIQNIYIIEIHVLQVLFHLQL